MPNDIGKALEEEIQRLANKLERLRAAKMMLEEEQEQTEQPPQRRQQHVGSVAELIMSIVRDSGNDGTDARSIVETARDRHGVNLNRASVSSMLSRWKKDGKLRRENNRYKI